MARRFHVILDDGAAGERLPDAKLAELAAKLTKLQAAASLREFRVTRRPAPDLTLYDYRFEATDGRQWRQVLRVEDGVPTHMTFAVSDFWRLDEFETHREVRNAVVALIREEALTGVIVDW